MQTIRGQTALPHSQAFTCTPTLTVRKLQSASHKTIGLVVLSWTEYTLIHAVKCHGKHMALEEEERGEGEGEKKGEGKGEERG